MPLTPCALDARVLARDPRPCRDGRAKHRSNIYRQLRPDAPRPTAGGLGAGGARPAELPLRRSPSRLAAACRATTPFGRPPPRTLRPPQHNP